MKKIILFAIIIALSSTVFAQNYTHSKIAEDVKYLMLIDKNEQLWYSNGDHIVMYNGEMHAYEIEPVKNENRLWEDNNGVIWGAAKNGIICFKDNAWKTYPYSGDLPNGSAPVMIFKDNSNRIYFFNETQPLHGISKQSVCIFDKGEVKCITENLPDKINRVIEYKDGVVFGNKRAAEPCGYYNGSYQYITEGKIYDFYNTWSGLFTSDATNLATPEKFEKYTPIRKANLLNDTLLFLTDKLAVCYFRNTDSFKEFALPKEHLEFVGKDIVLLYYHNNTFYVVSANDGVLNLSENGAHLLNEDNELANNELIWTFIDKNYNLVLMHPKSSSALLNGTWKQFDKKTGYELNGLSLRNFLILNGNKYIAAYNTSGMGKNNVLLQWDGANWESFDFKLKYKYTSNIAPFIFNNAIWFKYHNGNTYKGLMYFNEKDFTAYPLGKRIKDNWVQDVLYTGNAMYVHSSLTETGNLFKIEIQ